MPRKKYTQAQKLAYYKKLAVGGRGAYTYGSRARSSSRYAIAGKGAYKKKSGSYARPVSTAAGAALGGLAGSMFGPAGTIAGTAIGGGLGNAVGNIFGFGKYKISKNSLIDEGLGNANMHSNNSMVKVRHREYLFDVVSSGTANTFAINSVVIQPGLFSSFPWIAQIAQNYQEYSVLGMIFLYKPLTGTAISSSTNTTIGGIAMCTQYNVLTPAPINKIEMLNEEYSTEGPTYECVHHIIECGKGKNYGTPLNNLYVRGGAVPSGGTATSFDFGTFSIASYGVQGTNVVLGECHVVYEIALFKPIANSSIGSDILTDHFVSTTITSAAPLTGMTAQPNSSIGGTISASGLVYNFPTNFQEGVYQFTYIVHSGTPVTITSPGITANGGTILTNMRGDTKASVSIPANATTNQDDFIMTGMVQLTAQGANLTFGSGGTIPSTSPSADWFVTQYDANITTFAQEEKVDPRDKQIEELRQMLAELRATKFEEESDDEMEKPRKHHKKHP